MRAKWIKGYKVFNEDWTCRGFQYEVGKTYKHDGNIELCGSGFHYCRKLIDCFEYYSFNPANKVAEVEVLGQIESDDKKSVTNEIKIVKELDWYKVLDMVNQGENCTGLANSGNHNSGNHNSGNWNSGNRNSGNHNSGDCNSGNHNSGVFNNISPELNMFNKPTDWSYKDWVDSKARKIILWNTETTTWIYKGNMTEQEKEDNPDYETLGGYLKTFTYKEMWKNMWDSITEDEKEAIKSLPNFDKDIFKDITDIEI